MARTVHTREIDNLLLCDIFRHMDCEKSFPVTDDSIQKLLLSDGDLRLSGNGKSTLKTTGVYSVRVHPCTRLRDSTTAKSDRFVRGNSPTWAILSLIPSGRGYSLQCYRLGSGLGRLMQAKCIHSGTCMYECLIYYSMSTSSNLKEGVKWEYLQ